MRAEVRRADVPVEARTVAWLSSVRRLDYPNVTASSDVAFSIARSRCRSSAAKKRLKSKLSSIISAEVMSFCSRANRASKLRAKTLIDARIDF